MGRRQVNCAEMMRILVTGGAAHVGSVLTPALLARGWQVTVLYTFAAGEPFLACCCVAPNFESVRSDTRGMRAVEPLPRKADVVIHWRHWWGAALRSGRGRRDQTQPQHDHQQEKFVLRDQRTVYSTSNSGT